jgi:hypothetical protein
MASKSTTNRRTASSSHDSSNNSTKPKSPQYDEEEDLAEDALAYEHGFADDDDEEEEAGYVERANACVREYTRQREGRVVVTALASGFAIGVLIGGVIASSRERKTSWTDRLACEGLGRRLLDRLGSALPESISERLGR